MSGKETLRKRIQDGFIASNKDDFGLKHKLELKFNHSFCNAKYQGTFREYWVTELQSALNPFDNTFMVDLGDFGFKIWYFDTIKGKLIFVSDKQSWKVPDWKGGFHEITTEFYDRGIINLANLFACNPFRAAECVGVDIRNRVYNFLLTNELIHYQVDNTDQQRVEIIVLQIGRAHV